MPDLGTQPVYPARIGNTGRLPGLGPLSAFYSPQVLIICSVPFWIALDRPREKAIESLIMRAEHQLGVSRQADMQLVLPIAVDLRAR